MNYLAHAFLSCDQEELLVGNLLTDLMRLKERNSLPEHFQNGVQLHLLIDDFSDQHIENMNCKAILRPYVGKYAPVVLDIYQDHLLCNSWHKWSEEPFPSFCNYIHKVLINSSYESKAMDRLKNMAKQSWLLMYKEKSEMENVFKGVQKKISQPELFDSIMEKIEKIENELETSFLRFFPQMIQETQIYCKC